LQAWRNTMSPGSSMCSLKCSDQEALFKSLASARLRSSEWIAAQIAASELEEIEGRRMNIERPAR
jgi:hypothetical protein